MFKRIALFVSLGIVITLISSWGFLMHQTAHQIAVYQLPDGLQDFFYKNMDYLVYNAPRPDIRRNKDKTEGSKHYIDLEAFGPNAATKMPFYWDEAVAKYTKDTLIKYGYVPYYVIDMQRKLTNAFKNKDKDSILYYAADLGHYIEDAHVPLHTSLNHDGQLTQQNGLHSLWESTIPALEIDKYNLYTKHKATYITDPEKTIWNAVRKAHSLLPELFGQEIAVSKNFTDSTKYRTQIRKGQEYKTRTTAFAKAYGKALKNTINVQAIRASSLVADFWYTAWVDAGRPDLSQLKNSQLTDQEKAEQKKELNAFRKNTLIKENLLQSKQKNKATPPPSED